MTDKIERGATAVPAGTAVARPAVYRCSAAVFHPCSTAVIP